MLHLGKRLLQNHNFQLCNSSPAHHGRRTQGAGKHSTCRSIRRQYLCPVAYVWLVERCCRRELALCRGSSQFFFATPLVNTKVPYVPLGRDVPAPRVPSRLDSRDRRRIPRLRHHDRRVDPSTARRTTPLVARVGDGRALMGVGDEAQKATNRATPNRSSASRANRRTVATTIWSPTMTYPIVANSRMHVMHE